jgi:hypothetical protein
VKSDGGMKSSVVSSFDLLDVPDEDSGVAAGNQHRYFAWVILLK